MDGSDSNAQESFRRADALAVDGPAPATIMTQAARGDATEMAQPGAHAAVIGIDVLYVNGTTHALARPHIDALVGNAAAA